MKMKRESCWRLKDEEMLFIHASKENKIVIWQKIVCMDRIGFLLFFFSFSSFLDKSLENFCILDGEITGFCGFFF